MEREWRERRKEDGREREGWKGREEKRGEKAGRGPFFHGC